MKPWMRISLIVVATLLGLILASGLVIRSLVSGSLKDWFIASLESRTGTKVTIARADFDLLRWFIFRPAVTLHDVSMSNPPGFSSGNLLETKIITARVALLPLFRRRVEVESMAASQANIIVEADEHGHTNLEVFLKRVSGRRVPANKTAGAANGPNPPPKKEAAFAIDDLWVTSGTLTYSGTKDVYLSDIGVHLQGLCKDQPCQLEASAKIFNGKVSSLKVDGRIGPFTPDSLPLEGKLMLTLALSELPAELRRERFGAVLAAPGDKARAIVESSIKGDVYRTIGGPAKLTLASILIGGHPDHLMPLSGEAPGTITTTTLMTNPEFKLDIPDASLQFGKGHWKGSADFRLLGKAISGDARGAIRDVEIDEFLSTFTAVRGKIYGLLAMPSSTLRFVGANGEEIAASIAGGAKLSVTGGRLSMLDFPTTLRKVLGKASDSTEGTPGNTAFSTLTADLTIAGKKIDVANLLMEGSTIRLTGSGVIHFDHTIEFDVVARVDSGALSRIAKIGPLHLPSISADVPLSITGTLESPKVRPKFGKLPKSAAQGAAVEAVRDAVGVFVKTKKKNR
jgi:AsmA-like C-terminal region/AsmA family